MHVLISGATSGLGEALALSYAAPGVRLSLTGRRADLLAAVSQACRMQGAEVAEGVLDVRDRNAMETWILAQDSIQPIDLVIANAGIADGLKEQTHEPADATHAVFDINVSGVANTVMPLVPLMVARGKGQIALMSSLAGFAPLPVTACYSASKAAVRYWGVALRAALKPQGVKVTVLCPGFVRSPMTDRNAFPMPFRLEMGQAVRLIRRGLAGERAIVAFPAPLVWATRLLGWVPPRLMSLLFRGLVRR